MSKVAGLLFLVFVLGSAAVQAQKKVSAPIHPKSTTVQAPRNEHEWLMAEIDSLTLPRMYGRGYLKSGRDSAASYLVKRFKQLKLKPAKDDGLLTQGFAFPVNTFPGKMQLAIDEENLNPGTDFIIDPASPSCSVSDLAIKSVDFGKVRDSAKLNEILGSLSGGQAYYLENTFVVNELLGIHRDELVAMLPKGCYIIPEPRNLSWSVSRSQMNATVFYVKADAMPRKMKSLTANVTAELVEHATCENIIGLCPGVVRDTFIVIASHYDHLGLMGDTTVFPGASDGASGVAMMLSLAKYFTSHAPHYSLLFIAFSGEEASLMGSEFFVRHPVVPLKKIRFMMDIGMMADASQGISMVNGAEVPLESTLIQKINEVNQSVPNIFVKGAAANGDHYHFSELGVPSAFFYSNGGSGFYHSVHDIPEAMSLSNISATAQLFIDFIKDIP